MTVLTESTPLDINTPIAEEHPDGIKASFYLEDFLARLFQDIENINVQAGPGYGVIVSDAGTVVALVTGDTIRILGGAGISTQAVEGDPDALTIINDDPFPEAPDDGLPYGRQSLAWVDLTTLFIGDAPSDGAAYGRLDAAWSNLNTGDGLANSLSYFLGE